MTVIVGKRRTSSDNTCRLITQSDGLDQPDVTFPVPAPPPCEKYEDKSARMDKSNTTWYRYVVGVVALMNRSKDGSCVGIPPFEAVIATTVPLGGGLSSSAALEVATAYFIDELCKNAGIAIPAYSQQV